MSSERMGEGKILKLLISFSVPAMIGMLVNAIYNIVDRMFIGNAPELGSLGLAGVTISYPVTLVLIALSLMAGVGGGTRFSICLGKKEKELASYYQGNALMITTIFGLVFMILGNLFMEPLLLVLGASAKVLPYAADYLSIILFGAVFQCVAMCGNNFSRAQGNPKNAMISMFIGAGFNIVFDYILIVMLGMGMKGAALATIGGQFLSMMWQLGYLFGKRSIVPLHFAHLKLKWNLTKDIMTTGIPAFFMQMANSVLNIILNGTLATYGGDVAVSTIGIITSVQTFILMPISGLIQGQQPLISYNFGAGNMDRVRLTLKYAIIGASIIATTGFLCVQLFPEAIIQMFNKEPAVIALGIKALRIWYISLFLVGAQLIYANYFQCIGRIKMASILNLIRQAIALIPLVLILSWLFGLEGVFFAVPIADVTAFIITIWAMRYEMKHHYMR